MFRTKFQVRDTWSQASPLESKILISQQPPTQFWAGFLSSKGITPLHISKFYRKIRLRFG